MPIKNCQYYPKVPSWQKRHGHGYSYGLSLSVSMLLSLCLVSISASAITLAENPASDQPKVVASAAPVASNNQTSDNTALDSSGLSNTSSTENKATAQTTNPNTISAISDVSNKSSSPNSNTDSTSITADPTTDNGNIDITIAEDNGTQAAQSIQSTDTTATNRLDNNKEQPLWKRLEYLLGGLLIAALIWVLILIRKIHALREDHHTLSNKITTLEQNTQKLSQKIKSLTTDNKGLEEYKTNFLYVQSAYQNRQSGTHNKDDINNETDALSLIKSSPDTPIMEDLNAADRKQLSAMMTQWLMTSRGNTNFLETVPKELQQKIQYWQYSVCLWQQSSGIDAVELTQNTMHVAVISLTKPDRHGYAYCYKKPNSLSALWTSKSWYQVQKTNGTLIVLGDVLELN